MNVDGTGQTHLTTNTSTSANNNPAWSPDGSRIAFMGNADGGYAAEIYVMDADGSNLRRLTDNLAHDANPAWSPDGTKIAYNCYRETGWEVCTMNPDGSNQTVAIAGGDQADWSPDSAKMVYRRYSPGKSHSDIYIANADGSKPVNLTARISSTAYELLPDWSPEGTRIAFASNLDEKEGYEIYVIDVNGGNPRRLTDVTGMDLYPDWRTLP